MYPKRLVDAVARLCGLRLDEARKLKKSREKFQPLNKSLEPPLQLPPETKRDLGRFLTRKKDNQLPKLTRCHATG